MSTSHERSWFSLLAVSSLVGCSGQVTNSDPRLATGGTSNTAVLIGGACDKVGGHPSTGGTSAANWLEGVTGGSPAVTGGTSVYTSAGGMAGQTSTSVGCIGFALSEANVSVYTGGTLLIVERTGSADVDYLWSPVATVAVAGDTPKSCARPSRSSSRFSAVECPALGAASCGDTITVQISLAADGYAPGTGGPTPACQSPATTTTYTVPINCWSCPSTSSALPIQCNLSPGTSCSFLAPMCNPGGEGCPTSMKCTCDFNSGTGARTWSCPVS